MDIQSYKVFNNITLDVLKNKALSAMQNSYSPYSTCKVGCSLISKKTGVIYTGCNFENASYPAGICAERSALCAAVTAEGKPQIKVLCIVNNKNDYFYPCGVCLQALSEFCSGDTKVFVFCSDEYKELEFKDLLPYSFRLNK